MRKEQQDSNRIRYYSDTGLEILYWYGDYGINIRSEDYREDQSEVLNISDHGFIIDVIRDISKSIQGKD